MAPDGTRHGPSVAGINTAHLHSLRCEVVVGCPHHGSHTAIVEGPFQKVMDLMATFRQGADMVDRWVLTTYTVLDEVVPELLISDWD